MKNSKSCKFKVGDLVFAKSSFAKRTFEKKLITILDIQKWSISFLVKVNLDFFSWDENHFKLAHKKYQRKAKGFGKELESLINE